MRTLTFLAAAALLALNAAGAATGADYLTARARAQALLAQHQYPEALQLARELNHRMPDDLIVYGIMVDAHIALGDLKDAEKEAQWMLDLGLAQPNVPGLVRAARLRALFDDPEGALQLINLALTRTPDTDVEHRATMLGFGAWVELAQGKAEDAAATAAAARRLSPHNPCAAAVTERLHAAEANKARAENAGNCPCDLSF